MSNSPTETSSEKADPAFSIAVRTALWSAITFFAIALFERFWWLPTLPLWADTGFRILAVWLFATTEVRRYRKRPDCEPSEEGIFLSTVFFYGITLLFVYVAEILVVGYELVSGGSMGFAEELKFILGVRGFSTSAIVSAFFASHLPYVAYYFSLRREGFR